MEVLDPQIPWVLVEDHGVQILCVCRACGAQHHALTEDDLDRFASAHAAHQSASPTHVGAGDLIAAATKRVGIKPCAPCEARRRALNQAIPSVPLFRRR